VEWAIGAGDAQQGITGHCEQSDANHVRITFAQSRPERTLEIVQVGGDVLEVR
jgi:hypothetical protein